MAVDRKRVVGGAGEADVAGTHFKAERPAPAGPGTFPQPVESLCIDVLKSDSPLQIGERIAYRSDSALAEYRVTAVRSRPDGRDWWSAVLLERIAAIGGAASEARPEQCLDKGVDRDVRVTIGDDEGLSMLLDFYSGCTCAADPLPDEPIGELFDDIIDDGEGDSQPLRDDRGDLHRE